MVLSIIVFFLINILGKRSDLPFSRKSDRKKERSTVSFMHVRNIICSQTQLDGIAHEQTIIWRQLFAGHVVGSRPTKRKKNLLRMIICLSDTRNEFLVTLKERDSETGTQSRGPNYSFELNGIFPSFSKLQLNQMCGTKNYPYLPMEGIFPCPPFPPPPTTTL